MIIKGWNITSYTNNWSICFTWHIVKWINFNIRKQKKSCYKYFTRVRRFPFSDKLRFFLLLLPNFLISIFFKQVFFWLLKMSMRQKMSCLSIHNAALYYLYTFWNSYDKTFTAGFILRKINLISRKCKRKTYTVTCY